MSLFGETIRITGITYQLFVVFAVVLAGYLIGKINIRGIRLETAGVFVAALLFGAFFSPELHETMTLNGDDITSNAFKIIEDAGLVLFVGSVGMMAGPGFFRNLKKNFKSYILIGAVIIAGGVLASVACYCLSLGVIQVPADVAELGVTKSQYAVFMITGVMTGALTSTPAFSAAQATAATLVSTQAADAVEDIITTGHAVAYIFGVIGVVLFVQIIPKLLKADMKKEREHIALVDPGQSPDEAGKKGWFRIDSRGFAAFGLVVIIGIFIGAVRIPLSAKGLSGTTFCLTTTGGVLLSGLILSHFGHIGPVSIRTDRHVLEVFREFGLLFFLIGTGIPGGAFFVEFFEPVYFLYGAVITVVSMVVGYLVAGKLLKLPLLNSLGSITGGMTSTPALGALIKTAGTDDVAASYASAYPVALVCVVLASQFLILIFGS